MATPTQLTLYNDALLLCGERFLSSLTEEREPRRLLDQVWTAGNAVRTCLEMGQWTFAMRTVQIDYDSNIEPDFGYQRAFEKPTDWVLTSSLCSDEFFRVPLTRYIDEAGFWYADLDTLYVRYVSDDATYGSDFTLWPESFKDVVAAFLASKVVRKLTQSDDEEDRVRAILKKELAEAKNRTAMAQPTSFPPQGNWTASRQYGGGRRDGGNRGNLIG